MRAEVRKGNLSVSIRRQTVAESTGLSVKTVQRRINTLREIGWVRSENGQLLGEALVYELGYVIPGGVEIFYADVDCREFYLHLEELADRAEEQIYHIPVAERVRLAKEWVAKKNRGVFRTNGGGSESPTPSVRESHPPVGGGSESPSIIDNPSGRRIDKSEEYTGRSASVYIPDLEPEPLDRRLEPEQRTKEQKEEKELMAEFALDTLKDAEEDGVDDRLARAEKVANDGKAKADAQREAAEVKRLQRELVEGRTRQVEDGARKDQKARNLKGGTKYTRDVLRSSRDVWDLFARLVKNRDETLPVARWNADGNAKARGQVCRLVDMYGGQATIDAVRYVVGNWDAINERFFKRGVGSPPNFNLIASMHESLFREAAIWSKHRGVLEEWEAWFRDNPMKLAPDDLKERYNGAQQALVALGLG